MSPVYLSEDDDDDDEEEDKYNDDDDDDESVESHTMDLDRDKWMDVVGGNGFTECNIRFEEDDWSSGKNKQHQNFVHYVFFSIYF